MPRAKVLHTLANASGSSLPSPLIPLITGNFTFKGGGGKTTLGIHLATMQAMMGHNVLLVDADRQRNCTTWFQEEEGRQPPVGEEEELEEEDSQDVTEAVNLLQLINNMDASDRLVLPAIAGDRLSHQKLDPISSDCLMIRRQETKYDTVFSAVRHFILYGPRDIRLRQVQTADYNGQNGRGKMFLLEGANSKEMAELQKDFDNKGGTRFKALAAFRQVLLRAASQISAESDGSVATFVSVDMGPTSDDVNRVFALSCDVIQACVNPDSFSWSSVTEMLTDVLPEWLLWWIGHKKDQDQKGDSDPHHLFNTSFPLIMPFVVMKYAYDARARAVRWADSNFIQAITDAINELKSMVDEITNPAAALAPTAPDANTNIRMEDCWRDSLHERLKRKDYVNALQTIVQQKLIPTATGQVVVPLMRQFHYMAACHEMGRVRFDVSEQNLRDFYYYPDAQLSDKQVASIRGKFGALMREALPMEANLRKLANSYLMVLVYHNKKRQQQALMPVKVEGTAGCAADEATMGSCKAAGVGAGAGPSPSAQEGKKTAGSGSQKRRGKRTTKGSGSRKRRGGGGEEGAGPSKR